MCLTKTRYLDVIDICAKFFLNSSKMHGKVIVRIRMCVPIISNYDNANIQNKSVTLTFEEWTWFLDVSQRCNVIDICAQIMSKSLRT
jgi:hypothetical protein